MRRKEILIFMFLLAAVSALSGCAFREYEPIALQSADAGSRESVRLSYDGGADRAKVREGAGVTDGAESGEGAGAPGTAGSGDGAGRSGDAALLFGGDVFLSGHVLEAYEKAGGISGVLDENYRREIAGADLFFVNQEFPFSSRGVKAADKQYTFRLPPEKVSIMKEMGIGGVTLANNHALDYGTEALLDTCAVLKEAGIPYTGAGENLEAAKQAAFYEIRGKTFAIIGATRVIPEASWAAGNSHEGMLSAYDPTLLLSEVRVLSGTADYVIVYMHWGIEREEKPKDYQREMGKQLIDAGADLVVGAHPHVLQGIEYYQGKPIVYSLGNFVFGSSIPRTALLKAVFSGDQVLLTLLPGTSGGGYTRMLDEDEEKKAFMDYMRSVSFAAGYDEDGNVFDEMNMADFTSSE